MNAKTGAKAGRYKSIVTLPNDRDVVVVREFDAPRSLVFDAWTKPALLKRWGGVTTHTMTIRYASKEVRDAGLKTGMTDGMEMSCRKLDELLAEPQP